MPKLITKFKFMQPGKGKSVGGYAQYIATREGVEMIDDSHRNDPATNRQKKLIQKMLKDFPDMKGSHEYLDFKTQPTMGNASEFISRVVEDNMDAMSDSKTYADYIATRPRAERFGTHGLFTDDGEPVHLSKVSEELNQHQGNVWTAIISLRREDAERLGFNTGARWRDLLRTQTELLSTNLKIPMNHLRWYAAFHNESHHPHVHLIAYSTDPTEGRLTPKGVENIRSALAKDIFAQDLLCTFQRQTGLRDELRSESRERIAQVVEEINGGVYSNPAVEELLLKLADKLSRTSGKKVYGYLKPDVKAIIDTIVAELAKDKRLQELYNLWYEQREEVLRTYTDTLPERIPLEQNKDFKAIRNAVIQEALKIQTIREQEISAPEAGVPPSPETVHEPPFAPPVDDSGGEKEKSVRMEPRPVSRQGHPSVCRVGGRYMATASLRLLQELSRLIQNKTEEQRKNQRVDRKLKRQIEEKKQSLGIRG